jgi:hypothetical protein
MTLVIREFSILPAEEPWYRNACKLIDLPPIPNGYGVLHCVHSEDDDKHCAVFTTDLKWFNRFVKSGKHTMGVTYDGTERPGRQLSQDELPSPEEFADKFRIFRLGWPDEWPLLYGSSHSNS